MEEDDFLDDLMSWPSSSDTFEFSASRTPPPPDDTSPVFVGESVESTSCSSAQDDTTLSSNGNGGDIHSSNREGLNGNDNGR